MPEAKRRRRSGVNSTVHDCPCGQPHTLPELLHERLKSSVPPLTYGNGNVGAWRIPQIWVTLHGLPAAAELPVLGERYGWHRIA